MSEANQLDYLLTINTESAYTNLRRVEISLIRCLNFAEELTGDPNLKKGIQLFERAIMTLRMLQIALRTTRALMADLAVGVINPIGLLFGGTQLLATGMSIGDMIYSSTVGR